MLYPLTDKSEIRRRLSADREWSFYALADLDDDMFVHCNWWGYGNGLALVFSALAIRPVFVMGDGEETRELLVNLPVASGYLNLKPEQLAAAEGIYQYRERHQMKRMFLGNPVVGTEGAEPLMLRDAGEIARLYASGDGAGIAFSPSQLATGFFRGIRREGELIAAAGIHVVSLQEGVAGVGNIFTRADCRGQGLARTMTASVARALQQAGIATIGLNVEHTNSTAIRVYERLGFRTHFHYFEGTAERLPLLHS